VSALSATALLAALSKAETDGELSERLMFYRKPIESERVDGESAGSTSATIWRRHEMRARLPMATQ
jgi:hypothetical protein